MKRILCKILILVLTLNFYINAQNLEKYFPEQLFSKSTEDYYSSFFEAFDPVSIMSLEQGHNELRFSYIDSMAVSYIIKVDWTKHSRNMELIIENNPVKKIKVNITKSEVNELLKLLSKGDFYNQDSQKIITGARDGADYILETNIEGKYKVVSRWGPPYEDFMFNIHEFLVKKAGGQAVINSEGKIVWNLIEWIEE
jgi:hypothetical protein